MMPRSSRRGARTLAAFSLALAASVGAHAQDAADGRTKAQACAACHGAFGISTLPNAPNLAGQQEIYLTEQLKAYRSGKRENEIMNVMAKPLSDADIANIAAWFASIPIEVKPPR